MDKNLLSPDYLFETSWEICNKVGGINTVVSTKALNLVENFKDRMILIGPDLWRETHENPAFEEDESLFKGWRSKAVEEGLRLKIGRWKIIGEPIVILVDFSPFISKKNEVFTNFWETYKLDSLSGQRDYIEAAIFGFAAGKTIESFCRFYLTVRQRAVAQFHEWMTGAGILYLHDNAPHISTVFTTHATTLGRSIAGNGYNLYDKLSTFDGETMAKKLGVVSKHSLEKVSATICDCFTTVSEITARECEQFLERKVDIITPNGFEDNFVPQKDEFKERRKLARKKMLEVAQTLTGQTISEDVMFVANSGRYEFNNKGIDVFIHSLNKLNEQDDLAKEVVGFILVPANNYGPRKDLLEKLSGQSDLNNSEELENRILTHGLHDSEYDPILQEIKKLNLKNDAHSKVKIIYAPCYLNGDDGIFNLGYYDLLIGMDLTIFPSYYEPWGYTPLESLAFHVPTITTNLAGIGMWVNSELVNVNDGIDVFERGAGIDSGLVDKIVSRIVTYSHKSDYDKRRARENAYAISRIALWKNLIKYYKEAYHIALSKLESRADKVMHLLQVEPYETKKQYKSNKPQWKRVLVQSDIPKQFEGLEEMAKNLWWSWNYEAADLFKSIDEQLWNKTNHNPVLLLKEVSYKRLKELKDNQQFINNYSFVYEKFKNYIAQKPVSEYPPIAYFSMEYGLINNLKIYSGGLGILAGDYLKQASDSGYNMVGVGILYRYGYFTQQLSLTGEQLVVYDGQNFSRLPIDMVIDTNGHPVQVQVAMPGRIVYARIWKVNVGRVALYLLDTDFDRNNPEDRKLSHQLYGGDNEHRLKQEMLLGIGGIRALRALNINQDIYHCNEGHAAFIGIERMQRLINEENLTFAESLEIVRSSTLFTTHTPVPAGHDVFSEDLLMVYLGHYPARLKISWEEFMNLGRAIPGNKEEKFSLSNLAANLSQEMNGVSMLHGEVTKDMFKELWNGYYPEELHIGYVTNGVHAPSWTAPEWTRLFENKISTKLVENQSNKEFWSQVYKIPDAEIWKIRQHQRKKLIDYIKKRLSTNWIKRHEDPKKIVEIKNEIDENALTIGFARRFATYKRAYLLFRNLERLSDIVNNSEYPVQFIFAGKAHPRDKAGQDLIKYIIEISKRPEFLGKILFLENYDIDLAKRLVQGVDIWLNTPTRPLEASGTSGMKSVLNCGLNFSVLDGWWVEGYKEKAGWALPMEKTYDNQDFQDDLDAETIYGIFEHEIVPLFYKRDANDIPTEWVDYIKNSLSTIAPDFTTKRMIDDYQERYYSKLYNRVNSMNQNDYQLAKKISSWKKRVLRGWDSIEILSVDFPEPSKEPLILGKKYDGEVVLDLHELADIDIGVEILISDIQDDQSLKISDVNELDIVKREGSKVFYHIELVPAKSGVFNYGLRIFPKNDNLPHRQDFSYVRWI